MAERCSACGSADISTMGQEYSCLDCGARTSYDGLTEQKVSAEPAGYYTDPAEQPVPVPDVE